MKYLVKASVFFEVEADSYDHAMTQARVRVAEEDNTALDWDVEMIPIAIDDVIPVQDEWTGLPWDNPDQFCQLRTIPRGTPHWYEDDSDFCLGCSYQRRPSETMPEEETTWPDSLQEHERQFDEAKAKEVSDD